MLSRKYFEMWGSRAEAQLWAGECFFGPRLQRREASQLASLTPGKV